MTTTATAMEGTMETAIVAMVGTRAMVMEVLMAMEAAMATGVFFCSPGFFPHTNVNH